MQTNFQILFSVKVVHSYFENGICSCLQFSPVGATENMLNKYGFKLRKNIDGFDLFFNSESGAANLLDYLKTVSGQDCFDFDINSTDDNFVFFTELPADRLWQMEFESHDPFNSTEANSIVLHLVVAEQQSAAVGNLKVYFSDILNIAAKNPPANYIIRLKARSTQWQYYIINKNAVPLSRPSIRGKANISFKGPENVKLENGEEALFFYSDQADLPLSQFPVCKFDLVSAADNNTAITTGKSSSTRIIFKGLPHPDPADMGTVLIEGKIRPASPMYIYI